MNPNKSSDQSALPRWNLDTVYRGFDDPAFIQDKKLLKESIDRLLVFLRTSDPEANTAAWLKAFLTEYETTADLEENLEAFTYSTFSTDTREEDASTELNEIEAMAVPLQHAEVLFRNALASVKDRLEEVLAHDAELARYRFFMEEELRFQEKQMSPAEENLAADLSRAGGEAWGRLQESISSTVSMPWSDDGSERKTVIQLRALAFHRDRAVREKAFRKELEAWKQVEIPLSFALNGVKGFSDTLNTRRGFGSTLERSVLQARISPATLESLVEAMTESLPRFRTYFSAKAEFLGLPRLAFFDLFAPIGSKTAGADGAKVWSFEESRSFIVEQFGGFSEELARFADRAFGSSWIDAEPREGKVGGAYCVSFPISGESRVLCNFDGSFSSITTVAHELGHAYHHEVLKDAPHCLRTYPMTLAETASIFCEAIVFNHAIETAPEPERLGILETFLSDASQVIVDILSRFIFENEVMERRRQRELSPRELCELMTDAQKRTYGEALDENELHPYMWAVKGHYYRQDLAFYNFPYAFGQLFGLGLCARFEKEGPEFAAAYRTLLEKTGRASAVEVTREAGFEIESPEFWRSGLEIIGRKIDRFVELARTT